MMLNNFPPLSMSNACFSFEICINLLHFYILLQGIEMREGSNPSWFNPGEAVQAMLYCCQLAKRLYNPIPATDIGIIAPYKKQVSYAFCTCTWILTVTLKHFFFSCAVIRWKRFDCFCTGLGSLTLRLAQLRNSRDRSSWSSFSLR